MIHDDADHFATACFLLSDISSLSSYRSELEGIFRSLKHVEYLGMSPTEISHWCDNEAAVNKCMASPWKPSLMIQPDADILLAIHQIRRILLANGTMVICRHIYGHQDSRKRTTPAVLADTPDPGSDDSTSHPSHSDRSDSDGLSPPHRPRILDTPTLINIACDRLATDTSSAALQGATNDTMPDTIPYPLPGSKAQIRIGDTWITSHQRRHILWERRVHLLHRYCLEKYNWDDIVFDSIQWSLIRSARARSPHTLRMQTSKIMHGWLPVMHML